MDFKGKLIPLLFAAASGALMAIQGTFNSVLGKVIGLLEGTFSVHLIGTITAGILLFFLGNGSFAKMGSVPWFAWLGGPIGVAIIFGVAVSIPKLGVGVATTSIIAAQLLTAYLIDHFGLFGMEHIPFTMLKLGGIILIVVGSKLLLN
ncbi:transporter family-2 protein [Hydrogenispora ethanolica]|jgi:transporter family-2 protein|uniref:Transporter family-2 protein n=1 Tax=Hydrogenispora ethanolica TaxID=1082276 RepID=A0A4R1RDY2_HYDET|nr:DMT family transporter [Hydrogenispora ethanolica]TCL63762.1 transporter family-2 protein [Hydrogenispora ethanolica]